MSDNPFDYDAVASHFDPRAGIPARYNLGDALTAGNVAKGLGDKTALIWENSEGKSQSFTYTQLDELSSRLASALRNLGLEIGDRVFLRFPNHPAFYIAALAVAKAGGIFIPSSTRFREEEIAYRLKDSAARMAIMTTDLVAPVVVVASRCPDLQRIITVEYGGGPTAAGHEDFDRIIADGDPNFRAVETASDDPAFIAYTSGTTGEPKGVVHYHRYPLAYEGLIRYWHAFLPDDVIACPPEIGWMLPVASSFLYAFRVGLTVVLYHETGNQFQPARWFDLIARHRITNFVGTPTIFRMFLAAGDRKAGYDLSSWRHAVSAGEPLPAETFHAVRKAFGVTALDGLGMSECMVYAHNCVGMEIRPGSCGRPSPGIDITVRDDGLNEVPVGEPGVLCIRTDSHPGMMKEYWNKPEQTADIFRGQYYYSGDVVTRDENGYLWFKGRADDLIKASGYRISPFEVESALATHPAVYEAAAVPFPDPLRGSVVKAFVVLNSGFEPTPALVKQLQSHVKACIAPFKYPRKIEFVEQLPKTQSGKIKRKQLRDRGRP